MSTAKQQPSTSTSDTPADTQQQQQPGQPSSSAAGENNAAAAVTGILAAAAAEAATPGADTSSAYECPFCVMMRKGGCEDPFKVCVVLLVEWLLVVAGAVAHTHGPCTESASILIST